MEAIRWAVLALAAVAGWYCLWTADSQPLAGAAWTSVRWLLRGLGCLWPAAGTAWVCESTEDGMNSWERRLAWVVCILAVLNTVMFNFYGSRLSTLESRVKRTERLGLDADDAHVRIDNLANVWQGRDTAQTLINSATIDHAKDLERRVKLLEVRAHIVDGEPAIGPLNLPTTPRDD